MQCGETDGKQFSSPNLMQSRGQEQCSMFPPDGYALGIIESRALFAPSLYSIGGGIYAPTL
ncbi:hypothetical protein QQP08_027792 [Theobroma cacao]|nr:hypothetical protein QQP08_027792 [Theobroma cacao]